MKIRAIHFADSAFQDINGKWNLIGMYPGDIRVPAFPADLHLALYLEIEDPAGLESLDLSFKIGRKLFAKGSIELSAAETELVGVAVLPRISMGIDHETTFSIIGAWGGKSRTIISKPIRLKDSTR